MDETHAKRVLAGLLARFTAGSVLHLLGEVLREATPADLAPDRAGLLRDALGALFVVGVGLDAVWPGRGTDRGQGDDDEQRESE